MDNLIYWKTVACIVKLLKEGEGERVNGIKEILNFLYSHFSIWLRRLIPPPQAPLFCVLYISIARWLRGEVGGFWLCHTIKFTQSPSRVLKYFIDPPLLTFHARIDSLRSP